jgi:integrase/recombinase XerD
MAKSGRKPRLAPLGGVNDPESLFNYMQRFLVHLGVKGQSQHTVASSKAALTRFIRWCEERSLSTPKEIDRATVERFQQSLFFHRKTNGEPMSTRSQQFLLIPLRQWFHWMVKQGHLPFSPAADIDLPKVPKRLPKAILSVEEAEAVLAVPNVYTAEGLRDRAILEVLYSTGIRRMELTRLSIQDVDLHRGTVFVREGKGKKDRVVPIGDRALRWITAYRERARPTLLGGTADDGTLFLNNKGNAIKPFHLTMLVGRHVEKSGVEKGGACHLWRHTCATLMLEGGADIRYIQQQLGHEDLSTTAQYTKVSIQRLKKVHTDTHPGQLPSRTKEGA